MATHDDAWAEEYVGAAVTYRHRPAVFRVKKVWSEEGRLMLELECADGRRLIVPAAHCCFWRPESHPLLGEPE